MIPRTNTSGGDRKTALYGVIYDQRRNAAVLALAGEPIGCTFYGFRCGSIVIDAEAAALWFLFGTRVMGVDPSELTREDFHTAQLGSTSMLELAAVSAARCGVTSASDIACFFEAAFRGQLKDYELAFHRLRATGASPAAVAAALNSVLPEWMWQVQCAFPEAEAKLRSP